MIGSLTSYPARITTVHRVIETILNQSVPLDKVILYLADEQFPDRQLPQTLTDLAKMRILCMTTHKEKNSMTRI